MVNGISAGSNFTGAQALRALNAFKFDENTVQNAKKQEEKTQEQVIVQEPEPKLRNEISFRKANEIKQYGQTFDVNISNSDINYAFTYGRSIIVDYKA